MSPADNSRLSSSGYRRSTLDIENLENRFSEVTRSDTWRELAEAFSRATCIALFGSGGNLAIADHAASDIARLTPKRTLAPASGAAISAHIKDFTYRAWLAKWLEIHLRGQSKESIGKTLLIGFSSSGRNQGILEALKLGIERGAVAALVSGRPPEKSVDNRIMKLCLECRYYHTAETLSLLLIYALIQSAGFRCPSISRTTQDR